MMVQELKRLVDTDTFVYVIQGERWKFTTGPNRYLVNGDTRIPLFDEDAPEFQEDGFLGERTDALEGGEEVHEVVNVEPIVTDNPSLIEDDYFENEPDYDKAHDVEGV
jgi:hypothetical protein